MSENARVEASGNPAAGPDTMRLQRAIDMIAHSGGGVLTISPGRYVLGTVQLCSDLTVVLEAGATLVASPDYADFAGLGTLSWAEGSRGSMLYGRGLHNVQITGPGTIDGSAAAYFSDTANARGYWTPAEQRPRLIVLEDCSRIRIADLTIVDAPMWTVHLVSCVGVLVSGLVIDSGLDFSNTDAIDVDGCTKVRISDCSIRCADDAICIKTTASPLAHECRDVVVTNCVLESKSCAIKIGTETTRDVSYVSVSNCVVTESNRALGIFSRDGGRIRFIDFSDILFDCRIGAEAFWGRAEPICVSVRSRDQVTAPGIVEHVRFRNMMGEAEGAVTIAAEASDLIRDLQISAFTVVQKASESGRVGELDVRPPADPQNAHGGGLANAYRVQNDGTIAGVNPYPGGMPAIFCSPGVDARIEDVSVTRPHPLPEGWSQVEVVNPRF